MGVFYRKDSNKWIVRVRNKKYNIDYTKCFTSKTLAKKDDIRVKAEIESGNYKVENEKILFKEAAELYLQNVVEIHCKDSTKKGYIGYLNNHILPFMGNKPLCSITKIDIDKFITSLKSKKCKSSKSKNKKDKSVLSRTLSNETINHIIFLCGAIFEYMVESEVICKNPVKKVKKLAKDKKESKFLNVDECNKLLSVAKEFYPMYYPVLLFSIVTGMRQGEVIGLTWDDIDLKNFTVSVNKSYSHGKLTTPKTKSSIRVIQLPEHLVEFLTEYRKSIISNPLNLVFPSSAGTYLDSGNLLKRFLKPCLSKAGVKDITWHQLRHSCITALAENRVNIKSIQKQVGHSSEQTTLSIYTHATEKTDEKMVEVLNSAFEY